MEYMCALRVCVCVLHVRVACVCVVCMLAKYSCVTYVDDRSRVKIRMKLI